MSPIFVSNCLGKNSPDTPNLHSSKIPNKKSSNCHEIFYILLKLLAWASLFISGSTCTISTSLILSSNLSYRNLLPTLMLLKIFGKCIVIFLTHLINITFFKVMSSGNLLSINIVVSLNFSVPIILHNRQSSTIFFLHVL